MKTKNCSKCGDFKSLRLFYVSKLTSTKKTSWCSDCYKKFYESDPRIRANRAINVINHHESHPLYTRWGNMTQRCYNVSHTAYKDYGARGIKICDEWKGRGGYEKWYNYVILLPHCGEEGRTLDRIDNNGNYEPGNLRWATKKEQIANQRKKI